MRRPTLLVLTAVVFGIAGFWSLARLSSADQFSVGCVLDRELRSHTLTPDTILAASAEIDPIIGAVPVLTRRIKRIEELVCDTSLSSDSRLLALDELLENRAILKVLNAQKGLRLGWINKITGSAGTVHLVAKEQLDGRTCTVVDYPSMNPAISTEVVLTARERYCKDTRDEWSSDELLGYDAYRIPSRPKTVA